MRKKADWYCTCRAQYGHVHFKQTAVTAEGVCIYCDHAAFASFQEPSKKRGHNSKYKQVGDCERDDEFTDIVKYSVTHDVSAEILAKDILYLDRVINGEDI